MCLLRRTRMMNRFRLLIIFSLVLIGVSSGAQTTAKATFAGGCFWCMEEAFDKVEGVSAVTCQPKFL